MTYASASQNTGQEAVTSHHRTGKAARFTTSKQRDAFIVTLGGDLEEATVSELWQGLWKELEPYILSPEDKHMIIDGSQVTALDSAGASLVLAIERYCMKTRCHAEFRGFPAQAESLIELYRQGLNHCPLSASEKEEASLLHSTGKLALFQLNRVLNTIAFVGEVILNLGQIFRHPSRLRVQETLRVAEEAGLRALPVAMLIGFLLGLVLAFQSAVPMRQFGAEIYVANLLGLSLFRELGPLMAAIVLAGRTGSAFAAELGSMKVNEEVDALTTMGLQPVTFLVIPRMIAAIAVMPLVTIFVILCGLMGGALVMIAFGYPPIIYYNQIVGFTGVVDVLGGLMKSLVFGALVAGAGCYSGLKVAGNANAVGTAATAAVVSSIILVAIADGMFAVIYYYLDI
jgi:phospholipid/cholesterol/gamma-HCH transport system permease protein